MLYNLVLNLNILINYDINYRFIKFYFIWLFYGPNLLKIFFELLLIMIIKAFFFNTSVFIYKAIIYIKPFRAPVFFNIIIFITKFLFLDFCTTCFSASIPPFLCGESTVKWIERWFARILFEFEYVINFSLYYYCYYYL